MLYELLWGEHEDGRARESMIAECGLRNADCGMRIAD
jgi:hypothetical protein